MADTDTIEKPQTEDAKRVTFLVNEIERGEKFWGPYRKRCERILERYEDEREESSSNKHRYNIFWSNTETLKPLAYARVPQAQVLKRNPQEGDILATVAAEVLERAINFSSDCYDFDDVLKDVRDDFLLLAKGTEWIRYVPTIEKVASTEAVEIAAPKPGDKDEPRKFGMSAVVDTLKKAVGLAEKKEAEQPEEERVTYEEVISEYVSYQDFGTNKVRKWKEVWLVYRKVYLNRAACVEHFGEKIGNAVPLDFKPMDSENTVDAGDQKGMTLALVFECWDKRKKKAVWISKSYPDAPLKELDDPLRLKNFFPMPRPAFGTLSPRKLTPIPDYVQYQDLCREVDDHTARINILTKALKVVGMYAGEEKPTLTQVFKDGNDNKMIPVDSWALWQDKGGIKGVVEWVPIDKVVQVLEGLYKAREQSIAAIYQICAISDIMRGDTEPEETAAAQGMKSTWGSSRVREKQKEMARFCRDDMRIKGEIIAKHFSIATIREMTQYNLLTRAEKQRIEMYNQAVEELKAAHAQQTQMGAMPGQPPQQAPPFQPPPAPFLPDKMELFNRPTWEDVDELLKSDKLRQFRIDIEADSTVEPDMMAARRDMTEFVTGFATLLKESFEIVKAAPPMGKVVVAIAKRMCAKYEMGREVEDVIEKAMKEVAGMPRQPTEQELAAQEAKGKGKSPEELAILNKQVDVAAQGNQVKLAQVQADAMNAQADAQTNAMHAENERAKIAMEARMGQMQAMMERMMGVLDAMTQTKTAQIDARTRVYEADKQVDAAEASKPPATAS